MFLEFLLDFQILLQLYKSIFAEFAEQKKTLLYKEFDGNLWPIDVKKELICYPCGNTAMNVLLNLKQKVEKNCSTQVCVYF